MSDRLPLEQRKIAKFARKVDGGQLTAAVNTLQLKYGIPRTGLDVRGLPVFHVSPERIESRHIKRLICGGARPDKTFILFEPGLHLRAASGFSLRLSVLETTIHESIHCIDGERQYPGTYTDALSSEESGRIVSGFREAFYRNGILSGADNELFNEGVTQLLTLEVMREYLELGPYLNVTAQDRQKHFRDIAARKPGSFYPSATSFVQAFVSRIATVVGSEKAVWEKLYQDFFLGTSLIHDSFWSTVIHEAGIVHVMRATRNVPYANLPIHEAALRKNRGAWDEIRSTNVLQPIEE